MGSVCLARKKINLGDEGKRKRKEKKKKGWNVGGSVGFVER